MNAKDLPSGTASAPLEYPHFPTRWQAFVWRNWGLVPAGKLALVLQCSEDEIGEAAAAMGLERNPSVNPKWMTHGYLTLIRSNWQLLPYEQLLQLLDWTPEKMAYTLKEEDFFWTKLGKIKPACPLLRYSPLTAEQAEKTGRLKKLLRQYFPEGQMAYLDEPFSFADRFAARPELDAPDRFEFNYIHSYAASCGDVLGNAEELDPVPENLLAQYASMGIRGIWMHALLYLLVPIPGAEEYSAGWEKRRANLKRIVDTCAKYGLKVYLYLNEPRCMPEQFYEKKPLWGGIDVPANHTKTVCTTRSPEPLQWLEGAVKTIFTEARGLGGVFCITMSENPTNCHYALRSRDCPSCSKVLPEKIIADVITAMERGMHAADPEARMIAYDWSWQRTLEDKDRLRFKQDVMNLLPKSVYIASVSEWGTWIHLGGVDEYLVDYSISQVGPSEETLGTWNYARKIGLKVAAKVQINNSWELSAVPYIPVPYLINEHLENLKKAGVSGLMLSWTLGGFPGGNLDLLKQTPEEIAASKYHPELAADICRVWKIFSEAFRKFPFCVTLIYNAPMNYGPMNLLHLKNTGYRATMIGFPYDDLKTWCGSYPEETVEEQFRQMTEEWKSGLALLQQLASAVRPSEQAEYDELRVMAEASYCHLRSTYLQICFVRARNSGFDRKTMADCAREEIALAEKLHEIVRRDSRIGFEASNHYYYSLNDLREKVVSCAEILETLED